MILLYHKVAPTAPTVWWVTADTFNRQMAALAAYDVVPLSEYDPSNPRHVVITFDGVYENVYRFAFPILRKWGYPFELFVTGNYLGGDNAFDMPEPLARFCTVDQLQAMAKCGGRVQWHTATHPRLDTLTENEVLQEISVPTMLRSLFPAPHLEWFAYPHGDHSALVVNTVQEHFKGALSCIAGNDNDRYQLNRITVDENTKLDKSRVTVIVANYNYGAFLPEAMESVLKQTIPADEIILIDDGSTDGSQEIARRYEDVARVVLNEKNLGIVDNFNKAVSLATGDYIAFLGADNRMRSDYIEQCKTTLDRHAEAAVAYTDMVIFGSRASHLANEVGATLIGESIGERWSVYLWRFPDPTSDTLANLDKKNFIHGSSMYRRSVFEQVHGYRKSEGPEDHNLFKRMLQAGWKPVHIKEALIEYRQHSSNQANTVLSLQLQVAELRRLNANNENIRNVAIAAAIGERDAAIADLVAIRRSTSWRITAPIRFIGHIARGDMKTIRQIVGHVARRLLRQLPIGVQSVLRRNWARVSRPREIISYSPSNGPAISAIVAARCAATCVPISGSALLPATPVELPNIDITVVTFNSRRWIAQFIDSLLALNYPRERLRVWFIDNSSTDSTVTELREAIANLTLAGIHAHVEVRPNNGFGAGHNAAIKMGKAPYCLITNIDLKFEVDALTRIGGIAVSDDENVAAWELRQKPYEHPKFYDPVTGLTNWNSHACVLLRRSALEQIGGYDETLFMYGEDVELSYRLRRTGYLLRYCPQAIVWHFTYESAGAVKPLQYTGSTFANLYLRLKYGGPMDIMAIPFLATGLLIAPKAFPGARRAVMRNLLRLIVVAPRAVLSRRKSSTSFPFRIWDYELVRDGAFVQQHALPVNPPLVSIITRTYRGREMYLRQALLSVAHQTYPNIEHIIVEDGGVTMQVVVDEVSQATGRVINFFGAPKQGRSATGNTGLAAAKGRWCLFLDDDDMLFAEHVEVLVNALLDHSHAVAAYSPAWEVVTDSTKLVEGVYKEVSHAVPSTLSQEFSYEILKHHNFMAIQSVLFERRLYQQRGGFETDMDALEDWVLWLRYAYGHQFVYVPKVTSMFRTPAKFSDTTSRQEALNAAYIEAQKRATLEFCTTQNDLIKNS